MTHAHKIAVIGAGNVGGGLGARLAAAGFDVTFGVQPDTDVEALLARTEHKARTATPSAAAEGADVVVLAVPGSVAVDVVRGLGRLDGKVLVDCTNPLRWDEGPVWTPPPAGSNAAAIAEAAPTARVVKAFNTFGAEHHAHPERAAGSHAQVFLAGDDPEARTTVTDLAHHAGFHPIDAGPLRNAAVLENVAILWIHLATVGGQGRDFTLQVTPSTPG